MNYEEFEKQKTMIRRAQRDEQLKAKNVRMALSDAYHMRLDDIKRRTLEEKRKLRTEYEMQLEKEKEMHRTTMDKLESQLQRLSYHYRQNMEDEV